MANFWLTVINYWYRRKAGVPNTMGLSANAVRPQQVPLINPIILKERVTSFIIKMFCYSEYEKYKKKLVQKRDQIFFSIFLECVSNENLVVFITHFY